MSLYGIMVLLTISTENVVPALLLGFDDICNFRPVTVKLSMVFHLMTTRSIQPPLHKWL